MKPPKAPTLVFEWLERENIAVVCQNAEQPSPEEWQGNLDLLRRLANVDHRVLLYTEVHLTRKQQEQVTEATRGTATPRVAVMSPSTAVRFVASMFTLLNRNIRFFAPENYRSALSHLGCSAAEQAIVTRCFERLMRQVGRSRAQSVTLE